MIDLSPVTGRPEPSLSVTSSMGCDPISETISAIGAHLALTFPDNAARHPDVNGAGTEEAAARVPERPSKAGGRSGSRGERPSPPDPGDTPAVLTFPSPSGNPRRSP